MHLSNGQGGLCVGLPWQVVIHLTWDGRTYGPQVLLEDQLSFVVILSTELVRVCVCVCVCVTDA